MIYLKKIILFGCLVSAFVILSTPSVSAVQYSSSSQDLKSDILLSLDRLQGLSEKTDKLIFRIMSNVEKIDNFNEKDEESLNKFCDYLKEVPTELTQDFESLIYAMIFFLYYVLFTFLGQEAFASLYLVLSIMNLIVFLLSLI